MSTLTTTYGVAGARTYDELFMSFDMEPNISRFNWGTSPISWVKGNSGYILLTVTSLSWSSSASSFGPNDILTIDWETAGFDPVHMTQIQDTSGVPLTRYRITSPSGSISFSSGTGNEAKYVWVVKDGEVQGAGYNEDSTFSAARLRVHLQPSNVLTTSQSVNFTITYALTFTSLDTAIDSLSTSSTATLTIDNSKPLHRRLLSQNSLSGSGYGIFKVGQIASAVEVPPATSAFSVDPSAFYADPNTDPPILTVRLSDSSVLWNQYAARHARTKQFNIQPLYVLYAVNQGKISANADNVDNVYSIAELRLNRAKSQDNATSTVNYGLSFTSV